MRFNWRPVSTSFTAAPSLLVDINRLTELDFVRPLAAWFAFQLAMGIYLIHGRIGWFVVGAGRNGMEFSVLLLVCLLVIAMCAPAGHVLGGARAAARTP